MVSRSSLPHVDSVIERVELIREVVVSSVLLILSMVVRRVLAMMMVMITVGFMFTVIAGMIIFIASSFIAMMVSLLTSFMVVSVLRLSNIIMLSGSQRSVTLRIDVMTVRWGSLSGSLCVVMICVVIIVRVEKTHNVVVAFRSVVLVTMCVMLYLLVRSCVRSAFVFFGLHIFLS